MWATESTLQLIEELQMRRCLWDVSSSEYKDKATKAKAVAELAEICCVTPSEMDKKLHALKGQFRQEHRRLTEVQKSGGSPRKTTWFGYEPLLFLLPLTESRGSASTDDEDVPTIDLSSTTAEGEVESADSLPQTSTFQSPKRKKVCHTPDDVSIQAWQCIKSLTEAVVRRDRSHSSFSDFISESLQTANRPQYEVNLAKRDITRVILNLPTGMYADSHSLHTIPSHSTLSNSDGHTSVSSPPGGDSTLDQNTHSLSSYVKNICFCN